MTQINQLMAAVIPVTPFAQNCTLVWNDETKKGVVIDPGGEIERIQQAIDKHGVTVERILITHGHIDHIGGAADLAEKLSVPIEGPHEADQPLIKHVQVQAAQFGINGQVKPIVPDRWLVEGDTVDVGGFEFQVLHCPGHAPGHVIFYNEPARFAIVGDVLFKGGIGRTDLQGGDYEELMRSIKEKLLPLGDDVAFLPGHGPGSTLGEERVSNPFLQE
ncbi:MBL fold metallo-hydrolase [Breoghania sp.]|uniref:MBL fold metallo-hydrolase n=1 Tax=Breoghania sp. TaxID=2065378 RepID=UPI002AA863AA|nr:MBL fold metallo-hydrolase [Breoghania sp.]